MQSAKPLALLCFLVFISPSPLEGAEAASAETARVVASLLKIPLQPPEARVTVHEIREEENLIIEDMSWESLDSERPPAYLIRPKEGDKPLPAVICLHGSSGSRESMITAEFGPGDWTRYGRENTHQRLLGWARELARRGFVVLALTQRGLDSRTPDTNSQSKALLLQGRTLMGAIVYEIRQAVTLLQSRPEVDPARVGVTGMSFGGITSFYSWLVDDRIAAAAPICGGVGSLEVFSEIGTREYHGFYWWIPDLLTRGDHGDFAAAMAPRPLMLWAPLEDIGMPREGVDRFLEVTEPAYRRAGSGNHLVVHRPPGKHQFTLEAFSALHSFFERFLR